jgi:hypothetical protein
VWFTATELQASNSTSKCIAFHALRKSHHLFFWQAARHPIEVSRARSFTCSNTPARLLSRASALCDHSTCWQQAVFTSVLQLSEVRRGAVSPIRSLLTRRCSENGTCGVNCGRKGAHGSLGRVTMHPYQSLPLATLAAGWLGSCSDRVLALLPCAKCRLSPKLFNQQSHPQQCCGIRQQAQHVPG